MGADLQVFERSDAVRSLTLLELANQDFSPPRPPLVRRMLDLARVGLMAWGAISFGALAGMAAYYLNGAPETPLLVSENRAAPQAEAPPPERLAALVDIAEPSAEPALAAAASAAQPESPVVEIPEPVIVEARLPRPRPDEPIYTGSIGSPPGYAPWYDPPRRRQVDPCTALRNLGAPFLFGSRCAPQARVYAPPRQYNRVYAAPPPQYYPQPYQPPIVIYE